MDKHRELRKAKHLALALLLGAAALFLLTALLPRHPWIDGVRAVAEAAMVGALADWFAVVALFRRVPIPLVSRHTAIIPNNKDRIADNLAAFVREKFLDTASLVALIRRHDPAGKIAGWLLEPANTRLLGDYMLKLAGGLLDAADDARIQAFLRNAFDAALARVDLSESVGAVLEALTHDGRHQELLDETIVHLVTLLREPGSREFIAERIAEWLRSEHPLKEKLLPTGWIGEHGAELIADALDKVLVQVAEDPGHVLRQKFDAAVQGLIARLRDDPAFAAKGEEIKLRLRHHAALADYLGELWHRFRAWLKQDIATESSALHARVTAMGAWLGKELAGNAELRDSLNRRMEELAQALAPDFSAFLSRHISETVRGWDARDMAEQIELNIGKDLQYIRINGTLVGGAVGLLLYLAAQLLALLRG
jgi:uncharacterized membrane-anchored protein YjiN (DUF445 family)